MAAAFVYPWNDVVAADSAAGVWGVVIDVASEREAAVIVAGHRGISRARGAR